MTAPAPAATAVTVHATDAPGAVLGLSVDRLDGTDQGITAHLDAPAARYLAAQLLDALDVREACECL